MEIYLHNTLTHNKEIFTPINDSLVGMYSCGPTVYNYLHIGNLRAYIFSDILKRTLQYNSFHVKQIMNVTDIGHLTSDADEGEDKMVKALKRENKPMTLESLKEVGQFYFDQAKKDFEKINILPADNYTFASDEIAAQIDLIQKLIDKEFAYQTSEAIYFDTAKLPTYGRLGGSASIDHSRIGINSEKKDPRDFALWKFSDADGIGFDAPFGKGFPGWHIECSAMSMKYLGEQFDIHTGGIDHISVHHNNEIAQSEALTGKILANYWIHNNHLTIASEKGSDKMAKSGENFLTLKVLEEKNISPLAYRYWLLTSRYSTRMDYSLVAIDAAQTAFRKLVQFVQSVQDVGSINENYKKKFTEAINDDLDTPKALSMAWELIKDSNISAEDKKATLLDLDKVLGLGLSEAKKDELEISEEIKKLLAHRKAAKENKDFNKADEVRDQIRQLGFEISDNGDEQTLSRS